MLSASIEIDRAIVMVPPKDYSRQHGILAIIRLTGGVCLGSAYISLVLFKHPGSEKPEIRVPMLCGTPAYSVPNMDKLMQAAQRAVDRLKQSSEIPTFGKAYVVTADSVTEHGPAAGFLADSLIQTGA